MKHAADPEPGTWRRFWTAAGIRAAQTAASTALAVAGADVVFDLFGWWQIITAAAGAAVLETIRAIAAGLPEAPV